jgi:acyl-CoA thioesterase-1
VLAERLAAAGSPIRIVNAGLSGDTTSGGLRRLEWQLKQDPDILVVELGGNDALRGQDLGSVEQNLRAIVQRGKSAGALVLLLGMKIPPNYGIDYTRGFEQIYARIADEEDVPLVPFFMEGVVQEPGMMLSDGLHPSAAGHQVLADTVMPQLIALLERLHGGGN